MTRPLVKTRPTEVGPALRLRLDALYEEGHEIWHRFEARQPDWHPFVPADYDRVERALLAWRAERVRFLEWGSAAGVITIMADLLGFEAYGIELDAELVTIARGLADRFQSNARFAEGSFLPAGYRWKGGGAEPRPVTLGFGDSGYAQLEHPLDDFDLVFAFPWTGEEALMHDLMKRYGSPDALLLIHGIHDIKGFRGGKAARA